jgi:tRNA 2-selenouridine synthase SelU
MNTANAYCLVLAEDGGKWFLRNIDTSLYTIISQKKYVVLVTAVRTLRQTVIDKLENIGLERMKDMKTSDYPLPG